MTALVEVTQADRDAAADYICDAKHLINGAAVGRATREGRRDHDDLVRAFARHRIAALRPTGVEEMPWTPTEEMWGGLARDLMMWLDMGDRTPRALFRHLDRVGRPIPQWLRDEPEMQHLDHVPSKGTRCVLIWRAMVESLSDGAAEAAVVERCAQIVEAAKVRPHIAELAPELSQRLNSAFDEIAQTIRSTANANIVRAALAERGGEE